MWLPTVAFGMVLLLAMRIVKKPLVIPLTIGVGLAGFALVALAMGASIDEVRGGGWLLGPFSDDMGWNSWSVDALAGADWLAVARSGAAIVVAVVVAALVMLFDLGEIEEDLDRELDTAEELRDAGLVNLVSGVLGGIPGSHSRTPRLWRPGCTSTPGARASPPPSSPWLHWCSVPRSSS